MPKVRRGLTLIELLIVFSLVGIITTVTANSIINSRSQAIFQTTVQEVILNIQSARSQARAETDAAITGYGVQIAPATNQIVTFVDNNNNRYYDLANAADEQLNLVDLAQEDAVAFAATALAALEPGSTEFDPDSIANPQYITIFFPRQTLDCELRAGNIPGLANSSFVELIFAGDQDTPEAMAAQNPHQIISIHHQSCIPELSFTRLTEL